MVFTFLLTFCANLNEPIDVKVQIDIPLIRFNLSVNLEISEAL